MDGQSCSGPRSNELPSVTTLAALTGGGWRRWSAKGRSTSAAAMAAHTRMPLAPRRRGGGSRTIPSCTGGGKSQAASTRSAKPGRGAGAGHAPTREAQSSRRLRSSLIVGSLQGASQRRSGAGEARFDGADVDAKRLRDRLVVHVVHFAQQERGAIFGTELRDGALDGGGDAKPIARLVGR